MVDPELPDLPDDDLGPDTELDSELGPEDAELYDAPDVDFSEADQPWEVESSAAEVEALNLDADLSDEPPSFDEVHETLTSSEESQYALVDAVDFDEPVPVFEPIDLMHDQLPTPADGAPWSDASFIGDAPSEVFDIPMASEAELLNSLSDEQYSDAQALRASDDPALSALSHHWLG
ncbi:MAG: hypothetical protein HOQ05_09840 [Corynebacteriales bacterium]|nr:hypothetical protein [Mycobacteriales bacterium]